MNVPVSTPINKEEITSFINNAITMATKGGNTDIHIGIEAVAVPKTYSSTMPKMRTNATVKPIHFLFIGAN